MQVQSKCFRVQMKLDEYVNGENRDPGTLDKISSAANHPLTAAESLHPNDIQLLLTRAQYQATVSDNVMAAKGTLQHAKGISARKTVAPHLALAQVSGSCHLDVCRLRLCSSECRPCQYTFSVKGRCLYLPTTFCGM